MEVTLVTVKTTGEMTEQQIDVNDLKALQKAVGGYIEIVPYIDMFEYKGIIRKCIALCNEEGKLRDLPLNLTATRIWYGSMANKGEPTTDDCLVGDVAFVFGSPEAMAEF